MPPEHQDNIETAFNSSHGSDGSSFACGKVREIHSWIATLSLNVLPSTTSTGTLCLGLIFRYSADLC